MMARSASAHPRRGFFFTVLALVLVSFIFLSIQLWVQAQTQEEARMAERFRIEGLNTALGIVSNETVAKFVDISATYAVNRLATAIEDYSDCRVRGIKYYRGPQNTFPDGTYYLNSSIYELMIHGSTAGYLTTDNVNIWGDSVGNYFYDRSDPKGPNLTYRGDEAKYSLDAFFNRTRAAVRLLGYDVSWGEAENFTFNQTDAWTLQVNMTVSMNFTDPRGWVNVTRRIPVTVQIPIDGFTDPSMLRADMWHRPDLDCSKPACGTPLPFVGTNLRPHRNVYRALDASGHPIFNESSDAQAILKSDHRTTPVAREGLGWFFGPVVSEPYTPGSGGVWNGTNPTYNLSRIRSYIFMTSSADEARQQAGNFGGIILKTRPTWNTSPDDVRGRCKYNNHTQVDCLFCIRYQTANDTLANCPLDFNAFITPESIPIANPAISWISTDDDPTEGMAPDRLNYHLGLPEVLLSNEVNATDMCGSNFNATNLGCAALTPDPVGSRLEMKYSDESGGHAASKVWDLTGPRDMAICGFYVHSTFSPSYSQRFTYFWPQYDLVNNQYSNLSQGIESFEVGTWAGGKDDECARDVSNNPLVETYSRLDYQFYAADYPGSTQSSYCTGPFLKGMPGCKNIQDCNSAGPLMNGTGRFALSNPDVNMVITDRDVWPTYRYNVTNLTAITGTNTYTSECR